MVGSRHRLGVVLRLVLQRPVVVDAEHSRSGAGQARGKRCFGEGHRRGAVGEHEGDALARVVDVDRHVGAAGLEDGEHGHDHPGAALQVQAHRHVGAHAETAQPVRQLVGAAVERAVVQAGPVLEHDRHRIGDSRGLLLEQLVQRRVRRVVARGVVPPEQRLLHLLHAHHRQRRELRVRVGDDALEQAAEVRGHALDRCLLEQVAVVLELDLEPIGTLDHRHRQVELGLGRLDRHVRGLQARQRRRGVVASLDREGYLEKRVAPWLARRVQRSDDAVEGHVAVGPGVQRIAAHASKQLDKSRVARQARAHRLHVDEVADQPFQFRAVAPAVRSPDCNVVAGTVAGQQDAQR